MMCLFNNSLSSRNDLWIKLCFLTLCSHVIFAISDVKAISKKGKKIKCALEWVTANPFMLEFKAPTPESWQFNVVKNFPTIISQGCCNYLQVDCEALNWCENLIYASNHLSFRMWRRVSRHREECASLTPPKHLVYFITLNMWSMTAVE